MRNEIIEMIRAALMERERFFSRENEIQIYLANYFNNTQEFDEVFIEYHIPSGLIRAYPWTDSQNIYIDIVLHKNERYYPIEIKFKTISQNIPATIFGSNTSIVLGHHGAQNIGCYDFWKDIRRLELYESNFANVECGIMLFISNDESYIKPPLNANTGYAQFSIHEGRVVNIGQMLNWNKILTISANRPPITLSHAYNLTWNNLNLQQHKYLLL